MQELPRPLGDLTLRQQHPTSCGATCVAFRTGVSLVEAERVTGRYRTSTRRLANALRALGWDSATRLCRLTTHQRPQPGDVVKITWLPGPKSHWVVKLVEGYFDPIHGVTTDAFYRRRPRPGRATSFLSVFRPSVS